MFSIINIFKEEQSISDIKERQKERFLFLKRLYEIVEGDELSESNWVEIGKKLGFDRQKVNKITIHIMKDGLIKFLGNEGVAISHEGILEIEEALSKPNEATTYFPSVNELLEKKEEAVKKKKNRPKFTKLIKCRYCGNEVAMEIVREYNQIEEKEDIDPNFPMAGTIWEAGPVWQLALCPICKKISFLHYIFHNYFVHEGFEVNILYPTLTEKQTEEKETFFVSGKEYDAYKYICEKFSKAEKSIIIIDSHISEDNLSMLIDKKKKIGVKILTYKIHESEGKLKIAAKTFNKQHKNLSIRKSKEFHDRFIILDEKECYHIGASIKDAGNKVFLCSFIEDSKIIKLLVDTFNQEWENAKIIVGPEGKNEGEPDCSKRKERR